MKPPGHGEPAPAAFGEFALLIPVLASFVWVVKFFIERHYLPEPFVFDVNDTFMDWFNVAYYANRPGTYDVWHSVYPPLSFVFLRLFSVHRCYGNAFIARDCDWIGTAALLASYALDCVLAALVFRRRNRASALPRSLAFALGMPLLFTLERGNLILVCLIPFILAYGELLGSAASRALAFAMTINFKPYLVVPSLALAVRRDWRGLELAGLATVALYLVTLMLFGSGSPGALLENTSMFAAYVSGQFWEQSYYSTSYAPLLGIGDSPIPILAFIGSRVVEIVLWLIPVLIAATQIMALVGLIAAWLQPRAISLARNAALLMGAHLATQSPGGYTLAFVVFLVFLETGRRPGQIVALVAAYALSISYDQIIATVIDGNTPSWLSGRAVHAGFGLAVGQFVRPGLLIAIVWSLAIDSVTLSILAHRRTRPSLGLLPAGAPALG
jgi:hypothetical protein